MNEYQSIIELSQINQRLAEIRNIDEAKYLVDMAEAARVYAKQVGLGHEGQNYYAEIKLRAQRRAGEILDGMEKAKGGQPYQDKNSTGNSLLPVETYADLGIDKMDASRWQTIAKMPEGEFEQFIAVTKGDRQELTTAGIIKTAKRILKEHQRQIIININANLEGERYRLIVGDFANEILAFENIPVIITDPPYSEEHLVLYAILAECAAKVLAPGGSLLVMTGQYHLPDVISMMGGYLNYQWILAYLTPGGQSPQIWQRKVNTFWKPLLWFTKGNYQGKWIGDVCKSAVNDNDKRFHMWGQSESGMAEIIEKFSLPDDVILDPFCGGGTTGVVALRLNRRFIGIDKNPISIQTTASRIAEIC